MVYDRIHLNTVVKSVKEIYTFVDDCHIHVVTPIDKVNVINLLYDIEIVNVNVVLNTDFDYLHVDYDYIFHKHCN